MSHKQWFNTKNNVPTSSEIILQLFVANTVFNLHLTFNVILVCTPLGTATLATLHLNSCPLSPFPTLYVKSDITVYVSLAVLWLDRSVALDVTSFCPIVHCNVALGRLPVVVQVTSSGFVFSILPVYPVMVGRSGFTEII